MSPVSGSSRYFHVKYLRFICPKNVNYAFNVIFILLLIVLKRNSINVNARFIIIHLHPNLAYHPRDIFQSSILARKQE